MVNEPGATLDQLGVERWFRDEHGNQRWTTIYQQGKLTETAIALYSCLLPLEQIEQSLRAPGWDLIVSRGGPGFSQTWTEGKLTTTYHRPNDPDQVEPLVLVREFHHNRPGYVEISEEFRLLFNLYEDRQNGRFYEVEDDGTETEVIRSSRPRVEVRTALLRRYLAARQVALALQIDSDVWLRLADGDTRPALPEERRETGTDICYHFYSDFVSSDRPFSRFLGKKIVLPPARSECGIWPFEAPKEYLDFIIGEDDRGRPIQHSCNPDLLANYFGKNPDAPHYLTPVFFQREVLRKYYENSDRYEVGDGHIMCGGLWQLRADNNHADHVVVFLGDLGRDIPTAEQQHWRSYNISPEERKLSETAFRRSFLGEFADAELPEHQFKYAYAATNKAWEKSLGWRLFLELHPHDQHVLSSLRLPLSNTASEFDSLVLGLAKLLIDSLNEEQIGASLEAVGPKNEKGIAKLERLLIQWKYQNVKRDIALLRTIQGIRSRGSAHRKGSDYDLAQAGLDPSDFHASFKQLLERSTITVQELGLYVSSRSS